MLTNSSNIAKPRNKILNILQVFNGMLCEINSGYFWPKFGYFMSTFLAALKLFVVFFKDFLQTLTQALNCHKPLFRNLEMLFKFKQARFGSNPFSKCKKFGG